MVLTSRVPLTKCAPWAFIANLPIWKKLPDAGRDASFERPRQNFGTSAAPASGTPPISHFLGNFCTNHHRLYGPEVAPIIRPVGLSDDLPHGRIYSRPRPLGC